MSTMKYGMLQFKDRLQFVAMPATHMYQLTALHQRLHKEISKLTAEHVPDLPYVIAECDQLEIIDPAYTVMHGLDYVNELERAFSAINEPSYPLVSLLTEIRALQAQLEQWDEEEMI